MAEREKDFESKWALMRRTDIPYAKDPTQTYLARLRVIETPLFSVFLHALRTQDDDRHLHCHPWSFTSLMLAGGYEETFARDLDAAMAYAKDRDDLDATSRRWGRFSVHRIRRGEYHAITTLDRTPTWTLLFVGRRRCDWGFATASGHIPHKTYEAAQEAGTAGAF